MGRASEMFIEHRESMPWETKEELITNINILKMNPIKSKVKSVSTPRSWESNYGTMYSFVYEMEDGTTIEANHKSETGFFQVGEEVEYTVKKDDEFGKKGSVKKPDSFQGGKFDPKKDAKITRMNAFNRAVELTLSHKPFDGNMEELKSLTVEIEKFFNEA